VTVESQLMVLDWFIREPRLLDVACDGPRAPSAIRVIAATREEADSPGLLSGRLAEHRPPTGGDWIPSGEHAVEVIVMLAGLEHDDPLQGEPDRVVEMAVELEEAPAPESAANSEAQVDSSASAAQLQSLADELNALRADLARAAEAVQAATAASDEIGRERDVLRAKREDLLQQLKGVRQRRREVETELSAVRDQLAEAEARMHAATASELNADRLDQLARAARSIAARDPASADDLFVVERLHSAVPEDARVAQAHGILLSRLGRHEAARDALASLPREQLSRGASLALLRSSLAVGSVPDDIGALAASIRPSADDVRGVASHISGLASGRVVELTGELLAVVPDEEMSAWLATVTTHLTGRPLVMLLKRWADIEPDPALRGLVTALAEERLSMNDRGGAALALDLDWLTLNEADARDLAQRLATSLTRARDVPGLYRVLQKADHLAPSDRHRIGIEVIHAVAEIVPDREPITAVIEAGVRYVEDHRQTNRLIEAARLAGFVRQNLHRADEDTQALAELVLADVDRALTNSAIGQRVAEEIDREALGDVRRAVAGKRFLLVGGQRQDWYEDLRRELGFSGDSEWRESSRAEPPSMRQLKDVVKARKLDGMFLFTDFMSHKTSSIKETARQYEVPCLEAKLSRTGMIEALRTWIRSRDS